MSWFCISLLCWLSCSCCWLLWTWHQGCCENLHIFPHVQQFDCCPLYCTVECPTETCSIVLSVRRPTLHRQHDQLVQVDFLLGPSDCIWRRVSYLSHIVSSSFVGYRRCSCFLPMVQWFQMLCISLLKNCRESIFPIAIMTTFWYNSLYSIGLSLGLFVLHSAWSISWCRCTWPLFIISYLSRRMLHWALRS